MEWSEWRAFPAIPEIGDYVQVEIGCDLCNQVCMMVEGFYFSPDDTIENYRTVKKDKFPCYPVSERWRKSKPPALKVEQKESINA